jgi:hypothetical protein
MTGASVYPTAQGYYGYGVNGWEPDVSVQVEHLPDGTVELLRSLLYVDKRGIVTIADKGLVYNGGSKPKATWFIVGHPFNEYLPAYTIHDKECEDIYLALNAGVISRATAKRDRAEADARFKEGMRFLADFYSSSKTSLWERIKIRLKHRAVQLQAWWTI